MRSRKVVARAISASGLSIYDSLQDRPELFVSDEELEAILGKGLRGLVLDQPLRTRSKVLKSRVCDLLGYPVPNSFKRTQPRFPGQNFDTYIQKANNLQIWNEEVSASRRYVLIRVNDHHVVTRVRVVTGDVIAAYDKTGTLTHKYQAKARRPITASALVSRADTENVTAKLVDVPSMDWPGFLAVERLYLELVKLVGTTIANPGVTQERNRGGSLHEAVCSTLGGLVWQDNGQFPDVKEQLLEIKLQTATTIDLGLVCPDSREPIDGLPEFRHCDVRYAVFYGTQIEQAVRLDCVVVSTGADFFEHFRLFGGLVANKKYQIPLPSDFFA